MQEDRGSTPGTDEANQACYPLGFGKIVAVCTRCEGRPDGPCPLKKNDKSVHLSQGDLMLCSACENFRFPASASTSAVNPGIKATHTTSHTNTTSSSAERQPTEPAERLEGTKPGNSCAVENTLNEPNLEILRVQRSCRPIVLLIMNY
jgi:hypothetical protein